MNELEKIDPVFNELKSMNKRLFDLDEDVNRIDRDLSNDRKDIEYLKIQIGNMSAQLESVMGILTRFQTKTSDAVKDAVTEANVPIKNQLDKFVHKKIIHLKPSKKFGERIVEWFGKIYN